MTDLKNIYGERLPTHVCPDRSEIGKAYATVFTQPDTDYTPPVWHHQFIIREAPTPVAIRFCPFCGVRLTREHFT